MDWREFDTMTLDMIDREIRELKDLSSGKRTVVSSERLRALRDARYRITGYRVDP